MFNRRKFIEATALGSIATIFHQCGASAGLPKTVKGKPIVISTWDAGLVANKAAWDILSSGGKVLDAVEKGVMVIENSNDCCVGLSGNPDRDGFVTLDACIMDDKYNCGAVAFLERIKNPISVARRVMEKTPHVLLVGKGAQDFAIAEGFPLEKQELSPEAKQQYKNWLKTSNYNPVINIENKKNHGASAPAKLDTGEWNHDTIGMIAMDAEGNLSGSCTTSGMGFKMHGRVGDSPIIGAGLYVDNEAGACTATGQGEEVIRVGGAVSVVNHLRNGLLPEDACRKMVEYIVKIRGKEAKKFQVAFIAINKKGEVGAYAIHPGFSYAIRTEEKEELISAKSYFNE